MKRIRTMMCAVMAVMFGVACLAQADAISEAKARRKARRAEVAAIVQAGQAEEGDQGYLVAKGDLPEAKAAVVKAENADRRVGYEAIAKANGKTVAEVEKQAAAIHKNKKR